MDEQKNKNFSGPDDSEENPFSFEGDFAYLNEEIIPESSDDSDLENLDVEEAIMESLAGEERQPSPAEGEHHHHHHSHHHSHGEESERNKEKKRTALGRFFFKGRRFRFGRVILLLLLAFVIAAGVSAYRILFRPQAILKQEAITSTPKEELEAATPTIQPIVEVEGAEKILPEDPFEGRKQEENPERLNVLLLGVDQTPSGGTSSGTQAHSDVVMVIAIDFKDNSVDLISIPRDTFTKVKGHRGIYRLNSVFNLGGGQEDPEGGYKVLCELASSWMEGAPISYYYAVDFQAVVNVVDAMGGVYYDAETETWDGPNAVQYDGQAALGYLRHRDHNEDGDRYRTGRQRAMLMAIFNQLKSKGTLKNLPSILFAAGNGVDTNASLSETAALASYAAQAKNLTINSRILDGQRLYDHDWTFSFPDPDLRAEIIREVYGIEAEDVRWATPIYEDFLHLAGFQGMKHLYQAEKLFGYINEKYEEASMSDGQTEDYRQAFKSYIRLYQSYHALEDWYLDRYRSDGVFEEAELAERDSLLTELEAVEAEYREKLTALADAVNYSGEELSWIPYGTWSYDPDINEVVIDFN